MLGQRELTLDDYRKMLRRRLWVIVIPTLVAPLLAYLVSLKLPSRYTSQTLVLIENQKVPESYVQSVVAEDLGYRLGTMQEQILSRTRLQPIMDRFHLYASKGPVSSEEKVGHMRKDIAVKPVISSVVSQNRQAGLPGFSISFTYEDPKVAQQVCGEITSMFIEENLKLRQQSAKGTTEFLEKQLQESKKNLDAQDAQLAEFKKRHIGQLPQQEQTNMNLLMGLNGQLEAVTQALSRAQQDKIYTESILGQQIAAWEATRQDGTATASPDALQQQVATLQNQLIMLRARYTEGHPDVVKAKNDIAQMKHKLEEAEAASAKKPPESQRKPSLTEPAQIQQLRVALRQYEQAIKEKAREQDRIQQQIRVYQGRVQMSPVVEEQFKNLTRDYQQALNFYNELLAKKSQSVMATDLEMRQQGEQFRVMDPPNLPEQPSFPNRPLFALGGLGGGLGLGLVLAFVLELVDKSLRTEEDVKFYLNLPALALVPVVGEETVASPNGHRTAFWRRSKRRAAQVRQNAAM
jgi:polysaccharide chain length determinant protein (PEP-CTERM system associated)